MCKKHQLRDSAVDYFIVGSDSYFVAAEANSGGNPLAVMYQLLMLLGVKFNLYFIRNNDDSQFHGSITVPYPVDSKTLRIKGRYTILPMPDNVIESVREDCVIVIPLDYDMEITPAISSFNTDLMFSGYEPELALITVASIDPAGKPSFHSVTGFKCNGIYKVYDSERNIIYEYDWFNDEDALRNLGIDSTTPKKFYSSEFDYILYVKSSVDVENVTCDF